ncbi:MAG: hypothetical protein ABIN89_14120 [Chitinophagaceae bacterium]
MNLLYVIGFGKVLNEHCPGTASNYYNKKTVKYSTVDISLTYKFLSLLLPYIPVTLRTRK